MKFILAGLWCIALCLSSQAQDISHLNKNSYYTYIYQVPSDTILRLHTDDKYSFDPMLTRFRLVDSFKTTDGYKKRLPLGHYFFVDVEDRIIKYDYKNETNIMAVILPDYKRNKLIIRDKDDRPVTGAKVTYRHRKMKYDPRAQAYHIPFSNEDGRLLIIESEGEKIFYDYSTDAKDKDNKRKVQHKKPKPEKEEKETGYIVFNKPKYLPGDTVKFKAYLLHRDDKPYTQPLRIRINMARYGKADYMTLSDGLLPLTPGAYVYQFVLSDSFEMDRRYELSFTEVNSDAVIRQEYFSTEDYLLNKYTYSFSLDKYKYDDIIRDTIRMTLSGRDQNGMYAMDSRVRITAIASQVEQWYKDDECVPDTLFILEAKLSATADTKLIYPVDMLPDVRMRMTISADFVNSASEHQEHSQYFTIDRASRQLNVHQVMDTIFADLFIGGRSVQAAGHMEIEYPDDDDPWVSKDITYPFRIKADPMAEEYSFYLYGKDTLKGSVSMRNWRPYLHWVRTDTSIILFPESNKLPVYYTFYKGNQIYCQGMITDKAVIITDKTDNEYEVVTQCIARGEVGLEHVVITPQKHMLRVSMEQSSEVYPGKKDSVTVRVADSKGHPIPDANVTALSINNQFSGGPRVGSFGRHRSSDYEEPAIRESELDRVDDVGTSISLGDHPGWIKRAGLDTMLFYQLVFSGRSVLEQITPAPGSEAQFAPFVFDHGHSLKVHLAYVDGVLAYYGGASAYIPYSIPVKAGYHDLVLRTGHWFIHLDSLQFRDGEKADLMIELDSVKAHSLGILDELSEEEKRLLRNKLIYYKVQRSNDTAFIWQNGSGFVFRIPPSGYGSSTPICIPIGPMSYEMANFYIPHNFSLVFDPERNYAFSFSPSISRLEAFDQFKAPHYRLQESLVKDPLRFGEMLPPRPRPDLELKPSRSEDLYSAPDMYGGYRPYGGSSMSEMDFTVYADTPLAYIRVYRTDVLGFDRIFRYRGHDRLGNLNPGVYDVTVMTPYGNQFTRKGIILEAATTCHIIIKPDSWETPFSYQKLMHGYHIDSTMIKDSSLLWVPASDAPGMMGRVTNEPGDGLSSVAVVIQDTSGQYRSTVTDLHGYYTIPGLPPGSYTLKYSDGIYAPMTVNNIQVRKGKLTFLSIRLRHDMSHDQNGTLHEATVTAYKKPLIMTADTRIEQSVSYDMVSVESLASVTAGVAQSDAGKEYSPDLRKTKAKGDFGSKSLNEVVVMKNMVAGDPAFGKPDLNGDLPNLNSKYEDATKLRSGFSDYAYWQPNLITDSKGEARFVAKYPDDIASWRSYAIAMNTKHQFGVGHGLVRSYKDCTAELAVPQFLIAGDSSTAAIKISDYLQKPIPLKANFIWDGKKILESNVVANDVLTDEVHLAISPDETRKEVKASFNISADGGFGDGEERSIPIYPRGTDETRGSFVLLRNDTGVSLPLDSSLGPVTVRAQSDILDVLLDEIDHVRKYPYWCMEQTASRLIMLTMLEKINTSLGKAFKLQKEKQACISKLQKGQLINSAYGWWEYSPASVRITTYVLSALAKAGASDKVNIADAYRYLDASLSLMTRDEKLATLELYAETGRQPAMVMFYLRSLPYDSLSLHQQLQYVKAETLVSGTDSLRHWQQILSKKQRTIFGGSYWGDDNWYWYSNRTSATVLAYEIAGLRKDRTLQEQIIQYFLETRRHNGWRNTAESAKIVSAILPMVLSDRHGDLSSPSVSIAGIGDVSSFPYQATFTPSGTALDITKKGNAPVYFTAYQTVFNPDPHPVNKYFDVSTHFRRADKNTTVLSAGESSELVVDITTHEYCEYLMIEVPVPAGCTYGPKPQAYGYTEVHREYFKDKVVIFCESFQPGHQEFHIPIEARYRGRYTVNPANVQLMYFPVFYGRNEIRRIAVN